MLASPRADIDNKVGQLDRILIMFDHNHAVANIAQMFQGIQQAVIVALVQANRGFIQHIHDAGQATADL